MATAKSGSWDLSKPRPPEAGPPKPKPKPKPKPEPKPVEEYKPAKYGPEFGSIPLEEPTPEPVKEEPKPYMRRETPDVMGDWPKTRGMEPIPKKFLGLPEYRTKISGIITTGEERISESLKAEREWKAGITPTETYRVPMIGARHVSQEELDIYLAGMPSGWIPQYQIFTGAELLTLGESQYATYRKDVSTQLTQIRKHLGATYEWHPDTKAVRTDTGFEIQFPYAGAEKYKSYEKSLKKAGFGGLLATAFTKEDPLGLVSAYYTATGEKQKALDVKVKALHGMSQYHTPKGEMTLEGFGKYWIEAPITHIGIAAGVGVGIGAGVTHAGGAIAAKYGAGSLAAWSLKWGMAGVGGAAIGLTAADIKQTLDVEGPGEAFGKGTLYGFQFVGAMAGYVAGSKTLIRGATPYEWGFRKQFLKGIRTKMSKGEIDLLTGARVFKASKLEFQLRRGLRGVKPYQPRPDFLTVQTLEQQRGLREFFPRHLVRRKAGIFGSLSEARTEVHDLDVMYRNYALGLREAQYAASRFKVGDIAQYVDIKTWQPTGRIVGRMGTVKQPWYKTPEGYRLMRISESAMRHGESALELPHPGRVKDIPRAVELYTKLFEAKGSPARLEPTLVRYTDAMISLEQSPLVMGKEESLFLYGGKSFAERWGGFKTKVYTRFAPKAWQELSFQKTMGVPLVEPLRIAPTGKGLPPSPTVSLVPSGIGSSLAISGLFDLSVSPTLRSMTSIDVSKSIVPSVSRKTPSISASPSSKMSSYISNISNASSKLSSQASNVSSRLSSNISNASSRLSSKLSPSVYPSPSKSLSPSYTSYTPSYTPSYIPSPPPPSIIPFLPSIKPKEKLKQQGFDVYIKDRYIYEGKPRKPQRFKKINKYAMIRADAMSFGGTTVDQSAGASFKIKPASGKARELNPGLSRNIDPWGSISHKFYTPPKKTKDRKKPPVYVEKTTYRIDSPGEIKGISSLGWVASRRTKTHKKASGKKQSNANIFSVDNLLKDFGLQSRTRRKTTKKSKKKRR